MNSPINQKEFFRMLDISRNWLKKTMPNHEGFTKKYSSSVSNTISNSSLQLNAPEPVVEIRFVKTHPDAQLPSKAYSEGDNCFDLYCCEDTVVPPTRTTKEVVGLFGVAPIGYTVKVGSALVPVGLKVAYITPGFGFVVKDKSGLGFKHQLSHYGGEIDNGYRGDMGIKIANYSDEPYTFRKGDKVAQIKIEKIWKTDISFVDKIVPIDCPRGEGGFGSSGK